MVGKWRSCDVGTHVVSGCMSLGVVRLPSHVLMSLHASGGFVLCNLPWVSADCSHTMPSFSILRGVRCVRALVSKTQDLPVTGCALLPFLGIKAVGAVVPVGRVNALMVGSCLRQSLPSAACARAADPALPTGIRACAVVALMHCHKDWRKK